MKNRLAFWKGTEKDKEKENKEKKKRRRGHLSSVFGFDQKKIFFRIKEKRLSYPQLSEGNQYSFSVCLPGHYPIGTFCVESAVGAERKGTKPHAKVSRDSFSHPTPTPPSFTENRRQQLTSTENNDSYKYC